MKLDFLKSSGRGEIQPEFKEIQRLSEEFLQKVFHLLDSTQHRVTGEFSFCINEQANVEASMTTFMQTVNGDFNSGAVLVESEDGGDPITHRLLNRGGHEELLRRHQCSTKVMNAVFKIDKYRKYRVASKQLVAELSNLIVDYREYNEKHYYRYALDVYGCKTITAHREDYNKIALNESRLIGKTLGWFKIYLVPVMIDDEQVLQPTVLPIFEPETFAIDPTVVARMPVRF